MTKQKAKGAKIVEKDGIWVRFTRKPKDTERPLPSPANQKPSAATQK
jgi:hypothetical protein